MIDPTSLGFNIRIITDPLHCALNQQAQSSGSLIITSPLPRSVKIWGSACTLMFHWQVQDKSVRRVNRLMREVGIKASTTGLYVWCPGKHAFYSSTGNQLASENKPSEVGKQCLGHR